MLKYEKWSIFSGSDSCNTSAQNNNKNVQKSKNDLKEIPETNEVTPPQVYIISRLDHNSSSKRSKNTPKNYIWYVVHIIMQNITWRVNLYSSKGLIWKGGKNILGVKKRCRDLVTYVLGTYLLLNSWKNSDSYFHNLFLKYVRYIIYYESFLILKMPCFGSLSLKRIWIILLPTSIIIDFVSHFSNLKFWLHVCII